MTRRRVSVAAVLVTAGAIGSPAALAAQDGGPAADSLAATLAALRWGEPCDRWAAAHGATCEELRGDGAYHRLSDLWCRRAPLPDSAGVAYFHLLDPDAAEPSCGLTEFRWTSPAGVPQARLYDRLAERLGERYGEPRAPEAIDGPGSYWWRGLAVWSAPWGEVLLYRTPVTGGRPHGVHIRARSATRVTAAAADTSWAAPLDLARAPDADSLLGAALPPSTPGLGLLGAPVDTASPPRGELDALRAALAGAAESEGPHRAALLLLGDRLSVRVTDWASYHAGDSLRTAPVLGELAGLGVEAGWNPLGWSWANPRTLLRRAWREHPGTPAGAVAFAVLQRSGWDTSGVCGEGPDPFREVIRRGEAYLEERPDTPLRSAVALTLALAYDAWWSLGRAGHDTYVDPRDYRDGGDDARRRAIRWYEATLASGPPPALALYVRTHLALLRLGLDTNQRTFHCVYD